MIFYRYFLEYKNEDTETNIQLAKYSIFQETKKGYWIVPLSFPLGHLKKWVPRKENAHRQHAWDTKEKSMRHFINRTGDRVRWYKYWCKECEKGLRIANMAVHHGLVDEILFE